MHNKTVHLPSIVQKPEIILIFILSLCVFFGQLALRSFDDNRLTSWQWIFSQADMPLVSSILVTGLLLAMVLTTIRISHQTAILSLILSSVFISVSHWSNPEVIVDAGRYFSQAKYLEMYGVMNFLQQWGKDVMAWTDMPLVPFIYGMIFKLFGESRAGIQFVNTLFYVGTVYITYCMGRDLWSPRVGLYGAAMLLAIPYLHTQIPLLMVDISAMFFLVLAIYLFSKAINQAGYLFPILAALSIVLAMLTKYSNWLMISILPVMAYVYYNKADTLLEKSKMARQISLVVIGFTLFASIALLWGYELFKNQIILLMDYQLAVLGGWSESFYSTFLFQMHPFISIAIAISIYLAIRSRDIKYIIISWMLLLLLLLDIERIRYALIAFPMIALMAGYALAKINDVNIRRYLLLSILVSSGVVSIYGNGDFLNSSSAVNIKQAGEYIDSIKTPGVDVIVLEQSAVNINPEISIPLIDYHTNKQVFYRNELSDNNKRHANSYRNSPLRFSWEYKLPEYYESKSGLTNNAIAVVLSNEKQVIPEKIRKVLDGYYKEVRFGTQDNIFGYTTIVDVYLPVNMKHNTAI